MKPNRPYLESDDMHTVCVKCNLSYNLNLQKCPHCDYHNPQYYTRMATMMGA
jgi:ribosomal protein L37E